MTPDIDANVVVDCVSLLGWADGVDLGKWECINRGESGYTTINMEKPDAGLVEARLQELMNFLRRQPTC